MPFMASSYVIKSMISLVISLIKVCFRATLAADAMQSTTRNSKETAMTNRRATDNAKAVDAFVAAKDEIDAMLERLATLSGNHFDAHPDEINWGHVGTLTHYASQLRQITDTVFKEGEHAE
jgi:hypothetical protein